MSCQGALRIDLDGLKGVEDNYKKGLKQSAIRQALASNVELPRHSSGDVSWVAGEQWPMLPQQRPPRGSGRRQQYAAARSCPPPPPPPYQSQ